jgi:signal peptidase I
MESTVSQKLDIERGDGEPAGERTTAPVRARPLWRNAAEIIVMLAILVGLLNLLTVGAELNGSIMAPTLNDGQRVLASRITYSLFPPQRGDVVTLTDPLNPTGVVVLRVIGLPGERVELRGQQVLINSQPLTEDYLGNPLILGNNLTGTLQLALPPNQYFVLGDNRLSMNDSRSWGPVPASSILGRVWLTYWPPDTIALVQPARYDSTLTGQ